jgi:hypothetical protein
MKLSDQAAAALLMCLQKCIAEETDIMPLLKDLEFYNSEDELFVKNPPSFKMTAQQEFVVE